MGQVVNPMKGVAFTKADNLKSSNSLLSLPPNLPKGLSIQRTGIAHSHSGTGRLQQNSTRRRSAVSSTSGPPNKIPRGPGGDILASGEM